MASQKSIIKLDGSIGGICFYEMNGKAVARTSKGPDKETLLSRPNYIRMRENMKEFGGASTIGKTLRQSLNIIHPLIRDPYLTGRLTGELKKMIANGNGIKGERQFSISKHSRLLNGFELNPKVSFESICHVAHPRAQISDNKTTLVKRIPKFNARYGIRSPKAGSCFQFVFMSILLSDYEYSHELNMYIPLHPKINGLNTITLSNVYGKYDNIQNDIILTTQFNTHDAIPAEVGIIPVIGILFYEEVNGDLYQLVEGCAIKTDYE